MILSHFDFGSGGCQTTRRRRRKENKHAIEIFLPLPNSPSLGAALRKSGRLLTGGRTVTKDLFQPFQSFSFFFSPSREASSLLFQTNI